MADVDERHHEREVAILIVVALDELAPPALFCFRHFRVPVAGQVHEIVAVHIVEVDGGRLARRGRHLRQALAVHELVEQRRLTHVRASRKGNLGTCGCWQLLRGAVSGFKRCVVEVHGCSFAEGIAVFRYHGT